MARYNSFIGCRNALVKQLTKLAVLISHRCLLHPPPLVDLARDRKISGFFLPFSFVGGFFQAGAILAENVERFDRVSVQRPNCLHSGDYRWATILVCLRRRCLRRYFMCGALAFAQPTYTSRLHPAVIMADQDAPTASNEENL